MEFDSGSKELYYQRKVVESNPTIKFGDTIFPTNDLTGPICSMKQLDMQFNLFLGAYKASLELKFEPYRNRVWVEDRKIRSVCGTGLISVMFGCLSNATVANLKINISGATHVHGVVAARNSQLNNPSCTSVLFWKSSTNEIEVGKERNVRRFFVPNKETRISVKVKWDIKKNSVYSTYRSFYGEWEDESDSDEDSEG
ncbi:hypothetical protein POM88_015283 [Heracleum sosnowskyi]|uniref:Uncharacterized protein n=1 Tax=Heracleum sosnowskyi TaxID=360622 RepID=A0AAD8MRW5_9APIA|nr:hypothetical protein POM88_015278 [Heracleum sosnowskyi]KAK1387105.1 hypothetical protein POM88_015283 [Heracleum sosnowskyi]